MRALQRWARRYGIAERVLFRRKQEATQAVASMFVAAEPTVEATRQRIGSPLDYFTPQECANFHPKRRICCHLNGKCF